jgi:xylulokinase
VADVFELAVDVPSEQEGAALGAALQALWACTTSGSQADLRALAATHVRLGAAMGTHPDPAASAAYRPPYENFLRQLQLEIDRSGNPPSL